MIEVDLSNAGVLEEAFERQLEGHAREVFGEMLADLLGSIRGASPVLEGKFRDSLYPYAGAAEDGTEGADIEAVMLAWQLGDELGVASRAPHARKLVFQGLSAKAPSGWYERVVRDVVSRRGA